MELDCRAVPVLDQGSKPRTVEKLTYLGDRARVLVPRPQACEIDLTPQKITFMPSLSFVLYIPLDGSQG